MPSHTIRSIFLGIDVHKRTYSVAAVEDNLIVKRASMPADKNILLAFIHKFFQDAKVQTVYEAGFSGFGLHRFLESNGIKSCVVHAASIEVAANNKAKTDKRDSEKMAFQLSQGKLKSVNIPTPQREDWRIITRLRLQYVRDRSRISCRIKSLLFYFDLIPFSHKGKTSRKWILNLSKLQFSDDLDFAIKNLIQTWLGLDGAIKIIDKRLKEQAKKDCVINNIYLNQPGFGLTASRTLANELGDFSQFTSEKKLSSWIGLTPIEHSSGEHKWLGHITRQGNPLIRGILTECAWRAIKKDSALGDYFDRLVRNSGSKKKAIVAVARKLICRIRTEFIKGKSFTHIKQEKLHDLAKQ